MLRIGINPYGLAYTLGLQGRGTERENANPIGLAGFIQIAVEQRVRGIELAVPMLLHLDDAELAKISAQVDQYGWYVRLSDGPPRGEMAPALNLAVKIGVPLIRLGLTSILCGDRAEPRHDWPALYADCLAFIKEYGRRAGDLGVTLAVENHQDFGSTELQELCAAGGPNVGVCFDTGNALAVGEDPLAFARRVGPLIRHVHLKDYLAHGTTEGFRLVRCAVGDGVIPFAEIGRILEEAQPGHRLSASLEPGALEARHIRLFTRGWWQYYPKREATELAAVLALTQTNRIPEEGEWRTPWECFATPDEIEAYERSHIQRSVENMVGLGWLS